MEIRRQRIRTIRKESAKIENIDTLEENQQSRKQLSEDLGSFPLGAPCPHSDTNGQRPFNDFQVNKCGAPNRE